MSSLDPPISAAPESHGHIREVVEIGSPDPVWSPDFDVSLLCQGTKIICLFALDLSELGSGISGIVYALDEDIAIKWFYVHECPPAVALAKSKNDYARCTMTDYTMSTNERTVYRKLEQNPHANVAEALGDYPEAVYMRRYRPFDHDCSRSQRLQVYCDILEALSHLHSLLVVHGDVSEGNVLLDADGRAVLCEFGMSYAVGWPNLSRLPRVSVPRGGFKQPITGDYDRYSMASLIY